MKKVTAQIKLQIPGGKATPAPPVGPALGQAGVNIMDFCKNFNARTAKDDGLIIPVVITVYADRSYTFITKTPPVAVLIKKAVGIAKGSGEPNKNKVGQITARQVEEIAKMKLPDLNAETLEAGIPYGLPWEEIVTLEATPEAFAAALRANGIWTKKDLEGNVRAVMGVLQSVYGLDLAHLLRAAGEHEKKLEVTNG